MSRFILLAALGLAVAGGRAAAQDGGCGGCDGSCEKYGWHPLLKIRSWFGKKDSCGSGCGHGRLHGPRCSHGGCGPTGAGYGPAGDPGGTLVFPNHPFARSPRDFFMYEPK